MTFQITLTEQRRDDTVVPLLFGETTVDMPTLLCAYNVELMVDGGSVDCTRLSWVGDAGGDLVRVFADLTWGPFEELSPGAQLRFRIEQQGDFLLETRPHDDPRAMLADVLADSPTSGMSELDLLGALLWDAPIIEACGYAACCGWGIRSVVLPRVA
jgi:hypothetical protein